MTCINAKRPSVQNLGSTEQDRDACVEFDPDIPVLFNIPTNYVRIRSPTYEAHKQLRTTCGLLNYDIKHNKEYMKRCTESKKDKMNKESNVLSGKNRFVPHHRSENTNHENQSHIVSKEHCQSVTKIKMSKDNEKFISHLKELGLLKDNSQQSQQQSCYPVNNECSIKIGDRQRNTKYSTDIRSCQSCSQQQINMVTCSKMKQINNIVEQEAKKENCEKFKCPPIFDLPYQYIVQNKKLINITTRISPFFMTYKPISIVPQRIKMMVGQFIGYMPDSNDLDIIFQIMEHLYFDIINQEMFSLEFFVKDRSIEKLDQLKNILKDFLMEEGIQFFILQLLYMKNECTCGNRSYDHKCKLLQAAQNSLPYF